MLKLTVVYADLPGTCLALGMLAMTDWRELGRVIGCWVRRLSRSLHNKQSSRELA
jgi:hypothetical protein